MQDIFKNRGLVMSVYQMYMGARVQVPSRKKTVETRLTEININDVNPWVTLTYWKLEKVVGSLTYVFEADEEYWKSTTGESSYTGFINSAQLLLRPLEVTTMPREDKDNISVLLGIEPTNDNIQAVLAILLDNGIASVDMPKTFINKDKYVFSYFRMLTVYNYLLKRYYNLPLPLPFDSIAGKTPEQLGLAIFLTEQ